MDSLSFTFKYLSIPSFRFHLSRCKVGRISKRAAVRLGDRLTRVVVVDTQNKSNSLSSQFNSARRNQERLNDVLLQNITDHSLHTPSSSAAT